MLKQVLLACVLFMNAYMLFVLGRDLKKHRAEAMAEPGNSILQFLCTFVVMFLGAFGISDFSLFSAIYPKTGWVKLKKLPGTMIIQCTTFVMVAGITYIQDIDIQPALLISFIAAQVLGTVLGVRIAGKIQTRVLKKVLAASLLLAGIALLLTITGLVEFGGTATGLSTGKLIVACIASLFLGILKCMGVGSFPLTMALICFLRLHPLIAFPLMMGASALSVPMAAIQFIKDGLYTRKLALIGIFSGAAAAVIAVNFVKKLDTAVLQWIVLAVMFYAAVTMLVPEKKKAAEV